MYTPGSRAAMRIKLSCWRTKVHGNGEIRTRALSVRAEWIHQYTPNTSKPRKYTGCPRKNATTLIVNSKNIINKTDRTDFSFIMWKIHFPTKWHHDHEFWVRCLDTSAILVRQCHFQNLVLFRPHRTLEHSIILTSNLENDIASLK